MAYARKRTKMDKIIGAVLIVLMAVVMVLVIGVLMLRLNKSRVARYPVLYVDEIRMAAAENSIPAPYIAAVIMAESSYDPQAVSSVGAQGLMQIMPSTGEWISGKLEDEYADEKMFQPDTCIRYGSWYLGFLMDRYSGNMRCATAAYHAGQGKVDEWLANAEFSADGANLDVIPFDSTRVYVDRVLNYYDYYAGEYAKLDSAEAEP